MRYVLAILALAISGVLLLLGVGQRTFLEAPTEIVYPLNLDANTKYAVIDAEELSKMQGQANIMVNGNAGFAAVAKTVDAEGWLAPFDHSRISVDVQAGTTKDTSLRGEKPTNDIIEIDDKGNAVPIDPRGSDLWLETRESNSGGFRMPVALKDSQSVIIAGNGEEAIPANASIVWVQDRATPWAGPLLLAGSLFALLGAALYLIAFDRDKRALGPRRGRRGPLLGVRNVVGGPIKRAKAEPSAAGDGDPKKGGLTSAAALPPGPSSTANPAEIVDGDVSEAVSEEPVEAGHEEAAETSVEESAEQTIEEKQIEGKGDEDAK